MNSSRLPEITRGKWLMFTIDRPVRQVFIDSRKYHAGQDALFVAFLGKGQDGHRFIPELYEAGIRQFVVEHPIDTGGLEEANVLLVPSSAVFLQDIAAWHRGNFSFPVIGITGSNGKTVVKEWLYQALAEDHSIIKSPASYNSGIGVPLSVLPAAPWHTLGIFEAGISTTGEMAILQRIIRPDIGIFTNLLSAHDEGFHSREEKAAEKALLFSDCKQVVYCADDAVISTALNGKTGLSWSRQDRGDVSIRLITGGLQVDHKGEQFDVPVGFTDQASLENLSHVITVMLLLGYRPEVIRRRVGAIKNLSMRLEMKEALNGCKVIDDSYSNDLSSLKIALDFLRAQHPGNKVVILSDLEQSGLPPESWMAEVRQLLQGSGISEVVAIGPVIGSRPESIHPSATGYRSTEEFLQTASLYGWADCGILVKGARSFRLEQVVNALQWRIHGTVMEIDLVALGKNLNLFRSRLVPGTKLMVMVKAFAYGSGAAEVARFLEHNGVDYLGVAYADEGVALRNRGIRLPLMVMNPAPESHNLLVSANLEPAVYSLKLARELAERLRGERLNIHLKLDTGMHRLGFEEQELDPLLRLLKENPQLIVRSVYSHLAASEDPAHDEFSALQSARFRGMVEKITESIGYRPMRHLLNTAGILRHPDYHFELVRLGIGLYGIAAEPGLEQVVTLKTVISQIKTIRQGETVGYGRRGVVPAGTRIATIAIGYADGYSRAFGNGKGKVLINGALAPVVGNVCMDMTMVDITGIDAREGDEAVVFGKDLPPAIVAGWIGTIPYELLTSTGERIRRVFHSAG
ncbi:MAG: bifunctional UDP-N-acetylmuramoyl-tripeptide:D-alanyl-D-alanine ligase/alanine racemase [Bacteroidota bacterium]